MSSTKRGARLGDDVYVAPSWCCDRLMEKWQATCARFLEPTAGDGAIIKAPRNHLSLPHITAIDIREEGAAHLSMVADTVQTSLVIATGGAG